MSLLTSNPRRCFASGCTGTAINFSRYCGVHRWRFINHGSPDGRALTHRELKPFRALAADILDTYGERADVVAAIQWIEQKMLPSKPNPATQAELSRLRREGVTGREVLREALAVFAFSQTFPGTVTDGAHLTRLLGRNTIRLRRKRSVYAKGSFRLQRAPITAKAMTTIGLVIREVLSVLMLRLLKLHEHDKRAHADLLDAIKSGLPTDPPDLLTKRHQ